MKKIDVANFELNIPEAFMPEWYKRGIEPHKIHSTVGDDGMIQRPATVSNRRGVGPLEEQPNIKKAKDMEHPIETTWFDSEDQPSNHETMIDDNETINYDNIQKVQVPKETFDSVENIRKKLLRKNEPKRTEEVEAVDGDFVVLYKGKNIFVGDNKDDVRKVCEKIIIENESLSDSDLSVFYKVSLSKFFG